MDQFKKIYDTDRDISYAHTKIPPEKTKADIDALLYKWGIKRIAWDWDPDNEKAILFFELTEKFGQDNLMVPVKIQPPKIWHKTRSKPDKMNMRVSLRALFWYLKNELNWIFASQSRKAAGFLQYVEVGPEITLGDIILKKIDNLKQIAALPEQPAAGREGVAMIKGKAVKLNEKGEYKAEP